MSYSISYTSRTEQVTITTHGDTMVDALAKMVAEFGDGFTLLYEHAHNELSQLVEAVEDANSPRLTEEEQREREALAIFRGDVPDPDVPVPAASDPNPPAPPGDADGGGDPGGGDGPTCSICGTAITADRATASEIAFGERRCAECST